MHTTVAAGQTCPAFFGPNSGTSPTNMADNWMSQVIPSLLAQPNVTVLLTWDEYDSNTGANGLWEHVVTLEVGAGVTAGGIDGNAYSHYSLEAGLYKYFGLGTAPNNGATATPLPIPATGGQLYGGPANAITRENTIPGTTSWVLGKTSDGTNQQIDGYASATSRSPSMSASTRGRGSPWTSTDSGTTRTRARASCSRCQTSRGWCSQAVPWTPRRE